MVTGESTSTQIRHQRSEFQPNAVLRDELADAKTKTAPYGTCNFAEAELGRMCRRPRLLKTNPHGMKSGFTQICKPSMLPEHHNNCISREISLVYHS